MPQPVWLRLCLAAASWHVDLWDVVQPSSFPDNPPDTSFEGELFRDDAAAHGMLDAQLVSWGLHGFPGARHMPTGTAVITYPHAGAIRNAAALAETQERDVKNGFVTSGQPFPEYWPCVCDPMNIVVQNGKPRATIDKSMRHHSAEHPVPQLAYNDWIDLEDERERLGRPYRLVRVWQLTRAHAILATAGVEVLLGKFDLATYFRMHGKQRLHVWQSGRALESLFGFDYRVNFGERDAPDHTCRATDAITFFIRVELKRLFGLYRPRCARVLAWLAMRLGLADEAGSDGDFIFAVTFFILYYVDDAAMAAINYPLYNADGSPVLISVPSGSPDRACRSRQQTWPELVFDAAMGIARRYGHDTPEKKQSRMGALLEFLGVQCDAVLAIRYLTELKAKSYAEQLVSVRDGGTALQGGAVSVPYDECNSLLHKLLHASECIPLGRPHLFHLRRAVKGVDANGLDGHRVILGCDALKELEWWQHNLAAAKSHGVPFASRYDFPSSSDSTIVLYADASREPTQHHTESGAGAWSVIQGTFVYVEWTWTRRQVDSFSINVLETVAKDAAARCFVAYARDQGCSATHSLVFTDNTTAEHVAERGRASTHALNELNRRRQQWLVEAGVHQLTERVASVDNDVADLLSRGRVVEALRFATACDLTVKRLEVDPASRDTSGLVPTWP